MSDNTDFYENFYDIESLKDSISDSLQKYSQERSIGQYTPNGRKPSIGEMVDISKYTLLLEDIDKANISDDDKYFLRLAATRHLKFTYKNIADYYANSSPEVQKLMEDSLLVLIDFDDAISKGYVKMSKKINDIAKKDIIKNLEMRKEKEKNGYVYKQ